MFRKKYLVGVVGLIVLICRLFLKGSAQSMEMDTPKVTISFPPHSTYIFLNETGSAFDSKIDFELLCNATYPIEWIFHFNEDNDGTSDEVKSADTYRTVEDFKNRLTYNYSAKLKLGYNRNIFALRNVTCKATETDQDFYQTHVYMNEAEEKGILILEISNGNYIGEEEGTVSQVAPNRNNCDEAVAGLEYYRKMEYSCWRCFPLQLPENKLKVDFKSCTTPIKCNSMYSRQQKENQCLNLHFRGVSAECNNVSGSTYNRDTNFVLCRTSRRFTAIVAHFYFYGVMQGKRTNDGVNGPPIFFSWDEANATDMLYIHPIKKNVYLGESIVFKCEFSRYYFSLGSWFRVSSPSGMGYTQGVDRTTCHYYYSYGNFAYSYRNSHCDVFLHGTYFATTNVTFKEAGEHEVFCFGPVWNTTEWINASMTFLVEMGEEPNVVSVLPDESDKEFIIGQENRTLICSFEGVPAPEVTWDGPKDTFLAPVTNSSRSILRLREIGYKSSGLYTCTVSSFLGNSSKTFKINSHLRKLSGGAVAGIVVGCVILFIIVLAVVGRLSMVIIKQRQELRLLTESEVDGFFEGDPEQAKGKGDFLDSQFAIDALAYDKRYEIPMGNLAVEYTNVLGSGEFGVVVKGKINLRAVTAYVNLSDDGKLLDDGELCVAVKITKKDVDVTSFKGILSEVKYGYRWLGLTLMAYLGKHENLVSLIGASTENIKNRELLIAVEFCLNGSLDGFLKENKARFVNKVRYGYYTEDNLENEPVKQNQGAAYMNLKKLYSTDRLRLKRKNSGWEFSTLDLFVWTHDIAQGVEYIHNKKVIHGDLAIRNVLLTGDFVAKVGDFGLSRHLEGMASYTKKTHCPLPWRNMAIESLMEMKFSPRSDIWSLGVTIWELFTLGDVPYPGMSYSMDFLRDLENESVRLFKPPNATNDLYELLLRCWMRRPDERPSTTDVKLLCEKLFKEGGHKHNG